VDIWMVGKMSKLSIRLGEETLMPAQSSDTEMKQQPWTNRRRREQARLGVRSFARCIRSHLVLKGARKCDKEQAERSRLGYKPLDYGAWEGR